MLSHFFWRIYVINIYITPGQNAQQKKNSAANQLNCGRGGTLVMLAFFELDELLEKDTSLDKVE